MFDNKSEAGDRKAISGRSAGHRGQGCQRFREYSTKQKVFIRQENQLFLLPFGLASPGRATRLGTAPRRFPLEYARHKGRGYQEG